MRYSLQRGAFGARMAPLRGRVCMRAQAKTAIEFDDLVEVIRAVDSSDLVEMELKGKKFAMSVKKQEALQAQEPVYVQAPAAGRLPSSLPSSLHPACICALPRASHPGSADLHMCNIESSAPAAHAGPRLQLAQLTEQPPGQLLTCTVCCSSCAGRGAGPCAATSCTRTCSTCSASSARAVCTPQLQ